jgi:hypothetical protein
MHVIAGLMAAIVIPIVVLAGVERPH